MFIDKLFSNVSKKAISIDKLADLIDSFGMETNSGVNVSAESALKQSTVYACVRILSENIARLPLGLYKNEGDSSIIDTTHPINRVLKKPNSWQTPFEFWQMMSNSVELKGDAYAFKIKDLRGVVKELLPMTYSSVKPEQENDYRIRYDVTMKDGTQKSFYNDSIMHLRNMSTDGITGLSTIGLHKESVGLALQTQTHGASIFKNGASIGKVFETEGALSDRAYKRLKRDLKKEHTGAQKAGSTLILEEGLKANSTAMTNEDAQYLETRQFQVGEIASIFGVPLFLLQSTEKSTTWGSGLEQISKAFAIYTLGPRLRRIEQMLLRDILTDNDEISGKYSFKFDIKPLTQGNLKDISDYISKLKSSKVINTNEARKEINMNPIGPEGDVFENPNTTAETGDDPKDDDEEEPKDED